MSARQSRPTLAIVNVVNSVTTLFKSRLFRQAFIVVQLGLIASAWPSLSSANPLTQAEKGRAKWLAQQQPWPSQPSPERNTLLNQSSQSGRTAAQNAAKPTHQLAEQTVSVEPDIGKGGAGDKQVRVYQFNYQTASARLVVVLNTESVISESAIDSVHLPLNDRESRAALTLLAQNSEALALLRADQIRRGQKPFADLFELSVKASIFAPIDTGHPCAVYRCALLSLFDKRNTVFAMEPFVNLQLNTLGWLNR